MISMSKKSAEEKESRLINDKPGVCYYCGKEGYMHVHHIFEGSTRKQSDDFRLTVHLCPEHHMFVHSYHGSGFRLLLHQQAQEVFERELGSRDEFISYFIKSYL